MNTIATQWPDTIISENKRSTILDLIYANMEDSERREEWLENIESISSEDADEIIESLSNAGQL